MYRIEINRFYKLDSNRWASLLGIGLKEVDDHMKILVDASNTESQLENYNDCHNYLSSSIQDAIDTINQFHLFEKAYYI
jgi:poly(3-hydroxyalkanoate) synthetase